MQNTAQNQDLESVSVAEHYTDIVAKDRPAYSPPPWIKRKSVSGEWVLLAKDDFSGRSYIVCEVYGRNESERNGNAALIVRSVNNHERFLDAIRAYVRARNDGGVSMADLSTIADTKLRVALAEYEGSAK